MDNENLDETPKNVMTSQTKGTTMEELEDREGQAQVEPDAPDSTSPDEPTEEPIGPEHAESASPSITKKLSTMVKTVSKNPNWPNHLAYALAGAALLLACILLIISIVSIIQAYRNGSMEIINWTEYRESPAPYSEPRVHVLIWLFLYLAVFFLSISLVMQLKTAGIEPVLHLYGPSVRRWTHHKWRVLGYSHT